MSSPGEYQLHLGLQRGTLCALLENSEALEQMKGLQIPISFI